MALSREEKLARYDDLIALVPDIERKGQKTAYTSMNGNMFSFLSPDGDLAFRLSADERSEFLAEHPDAVVVQYDTVMKDYVAVPDALIEDASGLQALFERSVANARELKPKATTRRNKKTGKA